MKIAEAAPDAAVLIDEAYFEFCGETLLPDLSRHPNLFVGRTFSKVYGLAGLRLGVLQGRLSRLSVLRRFSLPFNVNSVVLACLEEALADQDFVSHHVAQVKEGRERLAQLCDELGLRYWPSQTNFVLVRVGPTAKAFVHRMQESGVLVRDSSGNPGCARMYSNHRADTKSDRYGFRSDPRIDHGKSCVAAGYEVCRFGFRRGSTSSAPSEGKVSSFN